MSNPVQNVLINKDLFYSIEDSDGPITLILNIKDIEADNLIFFEETKTILGIKIPSGNKILTKVTKVERYKDTDKFFITVKKI